MVTTNSVRGTVQVRSKTVTPPSLASCFIGVFAAGACGPISVNPAPALPLVPTLSVAASGTVGYYTYSAVAVDAAGNQSGAVSRVIAFDQPTNVPTLSVTLPAFLNSPVVTVGASASDNFDLWKVDYRLTYAGGFAGPLIYPSGQLNTFNPATLLNTNVPAGITIQGFIRQIQNVTGNGPLSVGGQFKPSALTGVITDQAGNLSAPVTLIPAASVANGTSYLAAPFGQLINSWAITAPAAATNISSNAGPGAPVNPVSVLINVDAFGPTATFSAPFARVDFYALVAGNLQQSGTTTSFTTVDDGSAFGRRHRYTFTWTPGTTVPLGLQSIYAVGVNAAGDALVTPVNANITVTNP